MSTAIARNFQIGIDPTPTNNFTLYQPATPDGTLRLGNGNTGITSSLLTLTSAGNLGIGNSSPTNAVTVGTTSAGRNIAIYSSSNGNNGLLRMYDLGGTERLQLGVNSTGEAVYYAPTGSVHAWYVNTERMRLDSSGNLGIGTSSPTNGYRLDVRGNVIASAASGNVGVVVSSGTSANGAMNAIPGTGLNINTDATDRNITFSTNSVERMRIAANGNVGIGVTPSVPLDVNGLISAVSPNNGSTGGVRIRDAAGNPNAAYLQFVDNGITTQYAYIRGLSPNGLDFNGAARIDSNARVLIATTTAYSDGTIGMPILQWTTLVGARGGAVSRADSTGSASHLAFVNPNGLVGNITSSGTTTSYGTSSDYRLKHDIAPMTGALAKVAALKPVTYKWNADNSDGEGFIAHELAEVCPQAVTGEKDAVDQDGNPKYQGIDTSFLVATLTAAIQELKAEFDAYKATHP